MTAAAAVAVKSSYRTDGRADAIFDALEGRLGPEGLDIAYEIASGYGGTQGGKRAAALLRRPEVLKRASVPLRIVVALREAPAGARRRSSSARRSRGRARARVPGDAPLVAVPAAHRAVLLPPPRGARQCGACPAGPAALLSRPRPRGAGSRRDAAPRAAEMG